MKNVTVIGAGSWGTALAMVLASNGHQVKMHTIESEIASEINSLHTNKRFLPGITLPENIHCYTEYKDAMEGSEMALIVVPSHVFRTVVEGMAPYVHSDMTIVSATKGIENNTFLTMTQIVNEVIPAEQRAGVVVLSGPSHAEEVARSLPTTVVSSCGDKETAEYVQCLFANETFRVYTNSDVLGVELAGAMKNVIALGAGISDGLGLGDNTKAALLTRGLAEMMRLGLKFGAQPETFAGLTGMGDLVVTGTSKHSRNWNTGNYLAQGQKLEDVLKKIGMVAEGVKTTESIYGLAKKLDVEVPITNKIYKILFEDKDPKEAINDLMKRVYTEENYK